MNTRWLIAALLGILVSFVAGVLYRSFLPAEIELSGIVQKTTVVPTITPIPTGPPERFLKGDVTAAAGIPAIFTRSWDTLLLATGQSMTMYQGENVTTDATSSGTLSIPGSCVILFGPSSSVTLSDMKPEAPVLQASGTVTVVSENPGNPSLRIGSALIVLDPDSRISFTEEDDSIQISVDTGQMRLAYVRGDNRTVVLTVKENQTLTYDGSARTHRFSP